jgi:transketolase
MSTDPRIDAILIAVRSELQVAMNAHKSLNSAHEAYAVIAEELDEFWDEVRAKREQRSASRMGRELIQVAAMACRTIYDLDLGV